MRKAKINDQHHKFNFNVIVLVINLLVLLPLMELVRFHIYLQINKITTFEYLKQQDKIKNKSKVNIKLHKQKNDD